MQSVNSSAARYQSLVERAASGYKPDPDALKSLLRLVKVSRRQYIADVHRLRQRSEWLSKVDALDSLESEMRSNASAITTIERRFSLEIARIERRQDVIRREMSDARHALAQLVSSSHQTLRTAFHHAQAQLLQADDESVRSDLRAARDRALEACVRDSRTTKVNFA